jgi:molecular chaperone GrpE (heat shock protein)
VPAAAPADPETLLLRVAKMQKQLVLDGAGLQHAVEAGARRQAEDAAALQAAFAGLARQVAASQATAESRHMETRRIFSEAVDSLGARIATELQDRVVERLLRTALAEGLDEVDAVLRNAGPAEQATAAIGALRIVRDKLLEALRPLGVEVVPVEAGATRFDEDLHEWVDTERGGDVAPGVVARVYKTGYTLRARAIRRAQVVVKGE